jgi:L-histidine N-alpha-methyltransferase
MLADVREGLSARPRQLPSKYFYDERGSHLFDEITRLAEYYPTRSERALLELSANTIVARTNPATLVELGAGNSDKTRLLLDEMLLSNARDVTYIPVDVSADFLRESAEQLRADYPSLRTIAVAADFSTKFALPTHPAPALHAFLGSTIGNFTLDAAIGLLTGVRDRMAATDFFLLGIDLRKDPAVIEQAYNDSRGITAAFNKNMLNVINDLLGADFDMAMFDHNAIYNATEHRIEMRLISSAGQQVDIPKIGSIYFAEGDAILTELSYKYNRDQITRMLAESGLKLREWLTEGADMFALALASR